MIDTAIFLSVMAIWWTFTIVGGLNVLTFLLEKWCGQAKINAHPNKLYQKRMPIGETGMFLATIISVLLSAVGVLGMYIGRAGDDKAFQENFYGVSVSTADKLANNGFLGGIVLLIALYFGSLALAKIIAPFVNAVIDIKAKLDKLDEKEDK